MKPNPTIKPMKPAKAVETPERYEAAILQAAAHFLARVPDDIGGRDLLSLLNFGSKAELKEAGVALWDRVPLAIEAAKRIDALARHMMAVEDYNARRPEGMPEAPAPAPTPEAPNPCPLEAAIKRAGIPMPPKEVLDRIREVAGITSDSKVEVTTNEAPAEDDDDVDAIAEALVDDDHGLPMECFFAMQKQMPGIRVVQRKVVSCPGLPVPLAQAILDMVLHKAKLLGLMD
jgi:hypothetical protein